MAEGVVERDAWQSGCLSARTEILDHGVGTEDVCRDVERVGAVEGVKVAAVEETDGAIVGG